MTNTALGVVTFRGIKGRYSMATIKKIVYDCRCTAIYDPSYKITIRKVVIVCPIHLEREKTDGRPEALSFFHYSRMDQVSPLRIQVPYNIERMRGALFGFAIGDALAAPTEFMNTDEIRAKYGTLTEMVGGGWLSPVAKRLMTPPCALPSPNRWRIRHASPISQIWPTDCWRGWTPTRWTSG